MKSYPISCRTSGLWGGWENI